MQPDDAAGNRQAQAAALLLAVTAGLQPDKALENPLALGGRDAGALILKGDAPGIDREGRDQRDAAGIEILDGEPQQRRRLDLRETILKPRRRDRVAEQLDIVRAHMSEPALRS